MQWQVSVCCPNHRDRDEPCSIPPLMDAWFSHFTSSHSGYWCQSAFGKLLESEVKELMHYIYRNGCLIKKKTEPFNHQPFYDFWHLEWLAPWTVNFRPLKRKLVYWRCILLEIGAHVSNQIPTLWHSPRVMHRKLPGPAWETLCQYKSGQNQCLRHWPRR